jgi:hypothetical protein
MVAKRDKKAGQGSKVVRDKRTKAAQSKKSSKADGHGKAAKSPKQAKPLGAGADTDLPQLDAAASVQEAGSEALARIGQLEADRTNLMAQVAWARAVAQEQQKTLELERARSERLAADLDAQRQRIEQLKSLSLLDRLFGRHKSI